MKNKIIVAIILPFILYGCGPTLFMPVSTDVIKQQQLLLGRKLYADHCSGCHNLYFPEELDTKEWEDQLDEMQVRAKITDEEKKLIYEYLTSQP